MVSEQESPTVRPAAGASASAMGMPTIPTTTRGGDQWRITDVVGIRTMDGAPGEAQPSRTCTGSGAIRRTRERGRLGPILTPAITVRRRAAPITTIKLAGARLLGAATTQMSTRETPTDIAAAPRTTRTLAL